MATVTSESAHSSSTSLFRRIPLRVIHIASLVWHWYMLYGFSGYVSDDPQVLGRYSYGFAAVVFITLVMSLFWAVLALMPRRTQSWIQRVPVRLQAGFMLLYLTGLFVLWFTSVDFNAQLSLSGSWMWLAIALIQMQPDQPTRSRRWAWGLATALVILMIPISITALTDRAFSPDEALWAIAATSGYRGEGIYNSVVLDRPFIISPGKGWSITLYGWLLDNVSFDPVIGRLWNLTGNFLAFIGIGFVTWRLYGRAAALVSAAVAAVSFYFIRVLDFRPDHQLSFIVTIPALAVLQARYSRRTGYRHLWNFIAGLTVTLGLQVHAASIVFVAGFSTFYLVETGIEFYRQRTWTVLWPPLWYGLGAGLGSLLYYILNIHLIGGLEIYLSFLAETRWDLDRNLRFLFVSPRLDIMLPLLAIGYLIWRRTAQDRLFLGLLGCVLLGIALLDSQGYRSTYIALYAVPVGTMLVHGFQSPNIPAGDNRHSVWSIASILIVMMGLWITLFINRDLVLETFQTGHLPTHPNLILGETVRPYTTKDDIILSTHELYWEFHEPDDHLVGVTADAYAPRHLTFNEPEDLWRYIAPTVIIDIERRMLMPDDLRSYMAEEGFQVCHQFEAEGHTITIYRTDCAT